MTIHPSLKLLAGAAVLLLTLAGLPAQADTRPAPATEASLKQLFQVQGASKLVKETLSLFEAQHAAQVERDTEPGKLEAARRSHERFAAVLRQRMTWDAVEPYVVKAYQEHYSEAEVQGLLAYYATEAGRLSAEKLPSVELRAMIALSDVLEQRLTPVLEDVMADRPVKRLPATKWKPANRQEQLAADLSVVLMKERFTAKLKTMEQQMGRQLSLLFSDESGVSKKLEAKIKGMAKAIQANLGFGDVQPVIVKELTASLSEAELGVLLADARLPERLAQRKKQWLVQEAANNALGDWMMKHLMKDLMQALEEEKPAAPAAE